jgi:hypothetical protein
MAREAEPARFDAGAADGGRSQQRPHRARQPRGAGAGDPRRSALRGPGHAVGTRALCAHAALRRPTARRSS